MTVVNEEPMLDFDPADLVSFTVMTGLCKAAHKALWPEEYEAFQADPLKELKRGSCLFPFTPRLDELGLMRLGGEWKVHPI
jgi:hypothetical protein